MALDSLLLEILVDPEDKEPLWYLENDEVLYNPRLHRKYAIRDGIPIMLISEATTVEDADHATYAQSRYVVTGLGPTSAEGPTA